MPFVRETALLLTLAIAPAIGAQSCRAGGRRHSRAAHRQPLPGVRTGGTPSDPAIFAALHEEGFRLFVDLRGPNDPIGDAPAAAAAAGLVYVQIPISGEADLDLGSRARPRRPPRRPGARPRRRRLLERQPQWRAARPARLLARPHARRRGARARPTRRPHPPRTERPDTARPPADRDSGPARPAQLTPRRTSRSGRGFVDLSERSGGGPRPPALLLSHSGYRPQRRKIDEATPAERHEL
jgi:hypothetical protein